MEETPTTDIKPEVYCEDCRSPIYVLDDDGYQCSCTNEYYCQVCYMGVQKHIEHNSYESDDETSD